MYFIFDSFQNHICHHKPVTCPACGSCVVAAWNERVQDASVCQSFLLMEENSADITVARVWCRQNITHTLISFITSSYQQIFQFLKLNTCEWQEQNRCDGRGTEHVSAVGHQVALSLFCVVPLMNTERFKQVSLSRGNCYWQLTAQTWTGCVFSMGQHFQTNLQAMLEHHPQLLLSSHLWWPHLESADVLCRPSWWWRYSSCFMLSRLRTKQPYTSTVQLSPKCSAWAGRSHEVHQSVLLRTLWTISCYTEPVHSSHTDMKSQVHAGGINNAR